jgi:hypothetical protein
MEFKLQSGTGGKSIKSHAIMKRSNVLSTAVILNNEGRGFIILNFGETLSLRLLVTLLRGDPLLKSMINNQ